jgi:type IV pilus assembly protein PilW
MEPNNKYFPFRQAGFSLVEILVGLAVGLLATLVIMQVFSVFEGQKRTTTGTADAQTNGSTALYTIERELQMAGYGLLPVTDSPLECATLTVSGVTDTTIPNRLSPVAITDGGTAPGASDSITIRYSTSSAGGIPSTITAMAGANAAIDNNMGCQGNNTALIINGSSCAMTGANAVSGSTTTVTLANTTGATAGANLACLGTWNEITYRVNNSNLERNGVPIIIDIVDIQAQYGISAAASSNQVTQWVDATVDAATGINWAAPSVANRNRIKAVRIAVVARNGLLEKESVTNACSSLNGASPTGLCAWEGSASFPAPSVSLSNDPDWQHYRYRVFETIIPLRNVIWSRDTL